MRAVIFKSWGRLAGMAGLAVLLLAPAGVCRADDTLDLGAAAPLDDSRLGTAVGGTEVHTGDVGINMAENNNTMLGNSVSGNVTTGGISSNTVQDVSGFNSMMYNTGNNVNFLNNTQVNVFLK